jgi:hypothetical protein
MECKRLPAPRPPGPLEVAKGTPMHAMKTILTASVTCALSIAGCSGQEVEQLSAADTERSVHLFECQTDQPMTDGLTHTMRFSVVGLDQPGFDEDFVWPEEDDSDCSGCPVTVAPADSPFVALNENGVVKREDGKLVVEGDSDGFYWAYLVMYENSGYTQGYVRLEDGGGYVDEYYGEASCTVTRTTAAPPVEPPDASAAFGFYVNDEFESADGSPLIVALYPPGAEQADGYAGFVDFAPWDEASEGTELHAGRFRLLGSAGAYEIQAETDSGAAMTAANWSLTDDGLVIDGVTLSRRHELDGAEYLKQCYALQVLEYEFEESFTPWEYPGVDVAADGSGGYEVSFGGSTFDSSEDEITVGENAQGDFEATVVTDYATYVLRVRAGNPARGQVLFGESLESLAVMANVGCYP